MEATSAPSITEFANLALFSSETALLKVLDGCEVVFHEAGAVGVGQSRYRSQNRLYSYPSG